MTETSAADSRPDGRADFWRRAALTVAALLFYRLGACVPIPGLDPASLGQLVAEGTPLWSTAVERLSIFALGVTPIFSALILAEFAKLVVPLRRWERARPENARLFASVVRWLALGFATVQGIGIAIALEGFPGLVAEPGFAFRAGCVGTLVAATAFLGWLGDHISRHGLGNGFWMLLGMGYLASIPTFLAVVHQASGQGPGAETGLLMIALYLALSTTALVMLLGAQPGTVDAGTFVWPPALAYVALTWLQLAAVLLAPGGKFEETLAMQPAHPLHFLALAVLVPLVTVLQAWAIARSAPAGRPDAAAQATAAPRPVALVAIVLTLITLAGHAVVTLGFLPFGIDGQRLVVLVVLAMAVVSAYRAGHAPAAMSA